MQCLVCWLARGRGFWAGQPGMYFLPFPSDSGGAAPPAREITVALIVCCRSCVWAGLFLVATWQCPTSSALYPDGATLSAHMVSF